jgi:hypothetical protein
MSESGKRGSWTVMVYFAADNDLDETAFQNLQLMKKVGSTDDVKIVAQLDTSLVGKTFRFWFRGEETTLEEDIIETLNEVNTGDSEELSRFVYWGMKTFPAQHYMLVLWGHGRGFEDRDHSTRVAARTTNPVLKKEEILNQLCKEHGDIQSISKRRNEVVIFKPDGHTITLLPDAISTINESDDGRIVSEDVLTIEELSHALKSALERAEAENLEPRTKKIDILGMDICMMGMMETGYHIRDTVELMLASEDTVPRDGWPYDRLLSRLVKFPHMSPEDFSVVAVREYLLCYRDQQKDVTLSACRLEKSDDVVRALKGLTDVLKEKLSQEQIRSAVLVSRAVAQTFYMKNYVDLYDFCLYLGRTCNDEAIREPCANVMNSIHSVEELNSNLSKTVFSDKNLIHTFGFCGHRLRNSGGVSIYFPCLTVSPNYENLQFAKDSGWFDFLTRLTKPFEASLMDFSGVEPATSGKGLFASPVKGDDFGIDCPPDFANFKIECGVPPRIPVMPVNLIPRSPLAPTGTDEKPCGCS